MDEGSEGGERKERGRRRKGGGEGGEERGREERGREERGREERGRRREGGRREGGRREGEAGSCMVEVENGKLPRTDGSQMALLAISMDVELEPATLERLHWYTPPNPASTTNVLV